MMTQRHYYKGKEIQVRTGWIGINTSGLNGYKVQVSNFITDEIISIFRIDAAGKQHQYASDVNPDYYSKELASKVLQLTGLKIRGSE